MRNHRFLVSGLLAFTVSLASLGSSINIVRAATLTVTTASLANATVGQNYSADVAFSYDGTSDVDIYFGNLPAGITTGDALDPLSATVKPVSGSGKVTLRGTPTQAGTFNVQIVVTDGVATGSKQLGLVVVASAGSSPAGAGSTPPANSTSPSVTTPPGASTGQVPPLLQVLKILFGPKVLQVSGDAVTYYITPDGYKIPMWTEEVFASYGNKHSEVEQVTKAELESYPTAEYIKLYGTEKIYYINLSEKTKHEMTAPALQNTVIDPQNIVGVNKTDFYSYKTGDPVK